METKMKKQTIQRAFLTMLVVGALSSLTMAGEPQISLSSGKNQDLNFYEKPQLRNLTLTATEPMGAIKDGDTIRISVPSKWNCRFDSTGSITLSGNATGKVGTPAFTNAGRTLTLPVTSDFANGDQLVIAGLKMTDLHLVPAESTASLELDYTGDGVVDSLDAYTKTVKVMVTGGFYDGWDVAEAPDLQSLMVELALVVIIR